MPPADAAERPDRIPPLPAVPRATYRVQLSAAFTFAHATAIVPYLAALGISHVYCSPYFRARSGSVHGYDVVDHNALNPEIGDRGDFERFVAALRSYGMGHILDVVPNHTGVMGADNLWWMDLLENGQGSVYADYFDIDWSPSSTALADKVLVPVLGEPYGTALERGELELRFERELGSFAVCYHEHRFPLDPRTYPRILDAALAGGPNPALERLRRLFGALPDRRGPTSEQTLERNRQKEQHKRALAALCGQEPAVAAAVARAVASLAGDPAAPQSFDALHELLEAQAYRLAYWRVAADDINYRRFFDVNDLAALRVENEAVFEATHRLVLELLGKQLLDGLRIDHTDGLYDPLAYLERLRRRILEARPGGGAAPPVYLVVEKITASFERLPPAWPVHGETGYRFANVVNRLLVDAGTRQHLDRAYRRFCGAPLKWADIAYECQQLVLRRSLASELNMVTNLLAHIAEDDRNTRDFTYNSLRRALAEVIACFPVYRTYVAASVSESDRHYIEWAIAAARRRGSVTEAPVLDFVRSALLLELPAPNERARNRLSRFVMKFQQITAPITAKGVEDTALYRFNRLVSLNEVGGEPDAYGSQPRAFHLDAKYRARHWPHEMLATTTHDTKRSEDVRARIAVLSEMPAQWRRASERWRRMNRMRKRDVAGTPAPSPNDEYLLYQTLIGTWPLEEGDEATAASYRERIESYTVKAAREAKMHTSWSSIDPDYEQGLVQFVRAALEDRPDNVFLADFRAFERRIRPFGLLNALSQTLLKLTAPGVPDIYQANELWDFSLVDPDNRRPVDFGARSALLAELEAGVGNLELARALGGNIGDSRCKLFLHWAVLRFRRAHQALFAQGEYLPLNTTGPKAHHLCAFARRHAGQIAVVLAPRLYLRLLGSGEPRPWGEEVWKGTRVQLPAGEWGVLRNVLEDREIAPAVADRRRYLTAAAAMLYFPVALLLAQ